MTRRLCLVLVVWLLPAVSGPGAEPKDEDAAAKDLAKLQGKWREMERADNGKVKKIDNGLFIEFEKDFRIEYDALGGVSSKTSVKLDPSKSPKEIDETFVTKEKGSGVAL